jgi:hypothetical protein
MRLEYSPLYEWFKEFSSYVSTKLGKEKNRCIREKTGAQNIVKEIKQYRKKWLQHIQRMDTKNTKTSTAI